MTPAQTQKLSSLVNDSDFLTLLIQNRPALTGANADLTNQYANKAEGWERCVKFLISLCEPEKGPAASNYINTSKLD